MNKINLTEKEKKAIIKNIRYGINQAIIKTADLNKSAKENHKND